MAAGPLATFVITCGWILLGLIVGIAILRLFWGWGRLKKIAFPFLDELELLQPVWRRDLEQEKPSTAVGIRQAGWAIAFAILSGFTISGLLDLIGQLATPAG